MELVERIKAQQVTLKALPETDNDQKNAKLPQSVRQKQHSLNCNACASRPRRDALISPDMKAWQNAAADVQCPRWRVLFVPKKGGLRDGEWPSLQPNTPSVTVRATAPSGISARLAERPNLQTRRRSLWSAPTVRYRREKQQQWLVGRRSDEHEPAGGGHDCCAEKAPKIGGRNWSVIMQSAQMASSVALAVGVHPSMTKGDFWWQMKVIVLVLSCAASSLTLNSTFLYARAPQAQEPRAVDAKESTSGAEVNKMAPGKKSPAIRRRNRSRVHSGASKD